MKYVKDSEGKLKDAENTIEYMKEEHKQVLEGLHCEISNLQQKCSGSISPGLCFIVDAYFY